MCVECNGDGRVCNVERVGLMFNIGGDDDTMHTCVCVCVCVCTAPSTLMFAKNVNGMNVIDFDAASCCGY